VETGDDDEVAAAGEDVLMRLAGVGLIALALAGCGSGTASSLEDAAEATGAETSRVEIVYRAAATKTKTEKEYVFRSTGLFDYPSGRAVMTTSDPVPFYGEGVELREIRVIGRTAYWRWVVKGKAYWMKQDPIEKSGDPAELLIPGPGTPTKPTDVLSRVLLASDANEKLGTEDVRGEETTHYRAQVNLRELVKQVPASERPPDELARQWGGPVVPVDIWIDGDSRLRKIVITRPANNESDPDTPALTTTVELYDYGVAVDVQPPEGELLSDEEFNELTGDSLTIETDSSQEEVCEPPRMCREDKKP
jgi:hypothetical protein